MPNEPLADFIQRQVPVTAAALAAIVGQFTPRTIRKNEFFLRQGAVSHDYLYLETGFLRAFTLDPAGDEVTTAFYGPNRVVFEVASFFTRTAAAESIQAVSDCHGYGITYDRLNTLFHTVPEGREFGRKMLVQAFVAFKQRTLSLISETAEQRYAYLLAHDPALFRYAQLRHIASYLGITDTSLSRIRREAGSQPECAGHRESGG